PHACEVARTQCHRRHPLRRERGRRRCHGSARIRNGRPGRSRRADGVSRRSARKPDAAWTYFLTCWLMVLAIMATAQPKTVSILDVIHYDAHVEPDIASKTVKGEVVVTFLITASGRTTIELDRGDLTIDSVREGGQARQFVQQGRKLQILLARPPEAREQRQLAIEYHGAPTFGLQFFPERSQVTTVFSTSQWLGCVGRPRGRVTLHVHGGV